MKESPIIFTGAMVRAIRAGRKTQTRRVVRWPKAFKTPPDAERLDNLGDCVTVVATDRSGKTHYVSCPYGGQGDRLWVRETFCKGYDLGDGTFTALPVTGAPVRHFYRADGGDPPDGPQRHWTPAIHMPRVAARLILHVVEYPDMERLQDVTESDAAAEGVEYASGEFPGNVAAYRALWDSINAARGFGWATNPWVWVTRFRPR